jgi:hypothetical protein
MRRLDLIAARQIRPRKLRGVYDNRPREFQNALERPRAQLPTHTSRGLRHLLHRRKQETLARIVDRAVLPHLRRPMSPLHCNAVPANRLR